MNALGIAMDTRALLSIRWTQPTGPTKAEECFARLGDGTICSPLNPLAATFTLAGAMMKLCDDPSPKGFLERHPPAAAVIAALTKNVGAGAELWSNAPGRFRRDVLDALDAVIKQLQREAA